MMRSGEAATRAAKFTHSVSLGAALGMAIALSSCATKPAAPPPVAANQPFKMYEWNGDGMTGSPSVVIYLDQQKATFYKGGKEAGWTYVATGRASHPTPSGSFKIMEKTVNKESNLYGRLVDPAGNTVDSDFNTSKETILEGHQFVAAKMPYFMRLTNDGVGMHVGPIPKPGATASHGCIRLPRQMAETFFANVSLGTPVTIYEAKPQKEEVRKAVAVKKGFFFSDAKARPMESKLQSKTQPQPKVKPVNAKPAPKPAPGATLYL